MLQSEIDDIDEANVTGNIDGGEGPPKTPNAFRRKKRQKTGRAYGHKKPDVFDYTKVPTTNKNIAKLHEADVHLSGEMKELRNFIDDSDLLFKSVKMPIVKQLKKMIETDKFTIAKAVKPFSYLVEQGAKLYAKEYGGQWNTMFTKKDRAMLALMYAQDFETSRENR